MAGIKGNADRQHFNPELVAMTYGKGSRKVEIVYQREVFALHTERERKKIRCERKREYRTPAVQG